MKAILSPAKSLDLETPYPEFLEEKPILEKQAKTLISILKKFSPDQIAKLMSVSPKLAELNHERFQNWRQAEIRAEKKNNHDLRPAIYMFKGDVYQGLEPHTLTPSQVKKMNEFTYILSGLYGVLKPLSLIRPYRLEMGTPLVNPQGKDLYQFWGDNISKVLNDELLKEKKPILVNLASEEYYSAVKHHLSSEISVIHPVFLDQVKGKYKIVSFYAKKARGLMVRYMIEITTHPEKLKGFNLDGYSYDEELTKEWSHKKFPGSKRESAPVFIRDR